MEMEMTVVRISSWATDIPQKGLMLNVNHCLHSMEGCRLCHIWGLLKGKKWVRIQLDEWTIKKCSYRAAREQPSREVMTLPAWVWATGTIDRWPSRLFTVKAPSIALLHYVTFNRALADWNSAPQCTFHAWSLGTSCPPTMCLHSHTHFSEFTVSFDKTHTKKVTQQYSNL